jgi:hypothetical protein
MKKIFTSALLIAASAFAFGQSAVFIDEVTHANINGTTMNIVMPTNSTHTAEILVTNTSSSAISYKIRRTIQTMDAADQTQFCWGGLCYGFTTNTSSMSLTINPGDTIDFVENGFHAIFNAGPAVVNRSVYYKIYDASNFSDSSVVTIMYNGVAGINDVVKADGNISNAYPNPASSMVTMKYDMNEFAGKGKIVFTDMLGKKVKEVELTDKQGTAKISVAEFNAGIYFYSFIIDDKSIATKKLVVSSK